MICCHVAQWLHARALVDSHTSLGGGPGQPQRIFQWVQVPATGVEQCAMKSLRAGALGDLLRCEITQFVIVIHRLQVFEFLLQFCCMTRLGSKMQIAGTQFAINMMRLDKTANQINGIEAELPKSLCRIKPHPFFNTVLPGALTGADMSAIAPGSAPAYTLGLEQYHVIAFFAQM